MKTSLSGALHPSYVDDYMDTYGSSIFLPYYPAYKTPNALKRNGVYTHVMVYVEAIDDVRFVSTINLNSVGGSLRYDDDEGWWYVYDDNAVKHAAFLFVRPSVNWLDARVSTIVVGAIMKDMKTTNKSSAEKVPSTFSFLHYTHATYYSNALLEASLY